MQFVCPLPLSGSTYSIVFHQSNLNISFAIILAIQLGLAGQIGCKYISPHTKIMILQRKRTECLILGGGVVGLSLAYELARRGHGVRVIDQGHVGRAASWAGAGILPPSALKGTHDPLEQLRGLSHQLHGEWAVELTARTGIDTGYRRCGGIYIARSRVEAATLYAQQDWWSEHGICAQACTPKELIAYEAALRPLIESGTVRAGWYMPDECQIRNPSHLQALVAACQQMNVELCEHVAIERVDSIGPKLRAISTNDTFDADQICVCAGAWSRILLDSMSIATGIMPVRGQMVMYHAEQQLLNHVFNEGHRYLVAREDGRLLAGSCEEEAGYEITTTPAMIAQLRDWAESILPQLRDCVVERTWAGLRPGSFDSMPYMGRVAGFDQLYVSAGHFRAGLHLSCGSAIVLADLMENKEPTIDITPFRIGRG